MTDRLRFGIVGTGNIASQFAEGVAGAARSVITAVGSRRDDTARAFADRFGVERAHSSYEAACNDPEVDAIYLSLPNSMHCEWTIRALEAGKHVLCEKPLAANESEAEAMFDAADRADRLLVEAFMYRCHPMMQQVVNAARNGTIGDLNLAQLSFCYHTTKIDGNVRFSAELAGGAMMDIGCYPTSLAVWLADDEPHAIYCVGQLHGTGVDETAAGVMRFESGLIVLFNCSMQTQTDNAAYICGTDGYLAVPVPWKPPVERAEYRVRTMRRPRLEADGLEGPTDESHHVDASAPLYGMEADAFAASVLDDVEPFMPRRHSMINMRILDTCRQQLGLPF